MNRMTDQELEVLRKKAKRGFNITIAATIILFIVLLVLQICIWNHKYGRLGNKDGYFMDLAGIVMVSVSLAIGGSYLAFLIFMKIPYKKFNCEFKEKYVLSTIQDTNLYQNLSYSKFQGFSYDNIRNAAVINCGESKYFSSEDMLSGEYKNVRFCFSDVETKKITIRNQKRCLETIFCGQVIRLDYIDNKKISDGYLQIFQKKYLSDLRGWKAEHKIQVEDTLFNQKFDIYSEDEHNAFYILTPSMLEKVTEFSNTVENQVAISFHGKTMFVAINGFASAFDANINEPVAEQKEKILKDVQVIKKAVDILSECQTD